MKNLLQEIERVGKVSRLLGSDKEFIYNGCNIRFNDSEGDNHISIYSKSGDLDLDELRTSRTIEVNSDIVRNVCTDIMCDKVKEITVKEFSLIELCRAGSEVQIHSEINVPFVIAFREEDISITGDFSIRGKKDKDVLFIKYDENGSIKYVTDEVIILSSTASHTLFLHDESILDILKGKEIEENIKEDVRNLKVNLFIFNNDGFKTRRNVM